MVKRYPAVFFGKNAPDQVKLLARGPLWVLDEDLIMGAVPISISASRTHSGVLEPGKNNF